jgi:eukaryotic-like serine/threonine-protein kinase
VGGSDDPTRERWQELDRLFVAALDLPEPAREAFLADSVGGDRELLEAVLALLAAERESEGLYERLDAGTARAALSELTTRHPEVVPEHVGPYRLLHQVGRGGQGAVYLARRADADFDHRVAVKVLRRGLDTDDVVRRFVGERKILAGLNHPNIARLFDGGSTEEGRPYFVMEYVEGTPITDYCDRESLPVRQRIELFLRVADAVRYAHTKLVVHRDLKPSNILVTPEAEVKLLDFGIAKLLTPGDESAQLTRTGVHVFTPQYASPEQLRGDPITTASDVYQLGFLLYVLLTGRRPFERRRGSAEGSDASDSVPLPSSVVAGDSRLRSALTGDLDTILLKALREEPERRYDSVDHLAGDLRAHLEGRRVSARPDTLRYRTAKLLRRHAWIAPSAAAAIVFLTIFAVGSFRYTRALERERNAATLERDRTREVQRLLVDLFRSADPFSPADADRGRAITVVEALDLGAARVLNELDGQPLIQAAVLDALADVYTNLGVHAKALPLAERALALHERTQGVASVEYRSGLARLAGVHGVVSDPDSALALLSRRLDLTLDAKGSLDPEVAEARADVASHLKHALNRPVEAEAEYLRVLAMTDSTEVPALALANTHRGLADVEVILGRPGDAAVHARRAVELNREIFGANALNTAMAHESLAKVLGALGETGEAESEFERALAILEQTLGAENGNTLNALNNLALLRRQTGDLAGAEQALRRLLAANVRARGEGDREVGSTYQNLGTVLADQNRLDEAAEMHARAAEIYVQALGAGDYLAALPYLSLSGLELRRGGHQAAESHARRALGILESTLPPAHFTIAVARCRLGRALAAQGHTARALPLLHAASDALASDTSVPAYREECLDALARMEAEIGGEPDPSHDDAFPRAGRGSGSGPP